MLASADNRRKGLFGKTLVVSLFKRAFNLISLVFKNREEQSSWTIHGNNDKNDEYNDNK